MKIYKTIQILHIPKSQPLFNSNAGNHIMHSNTATKQYEMKDLIDEELYHELEEDLDPEDIEEIIFASFDEVQDLLTELAPALEDKDFQKTSTLAHKIKGCASSACAKELSKTAAELEKTHSIQNENQYDLNELINIFAQSKKIFQKILNS